MVGARTRSLRCPPRFVPAVVDAPNRRLALVSTDNLPTSRPGDVLDLLAEAGDALAQHLNAENTLQDWQDSPDMDVVVGIARLLEQAGRKPSPCMVEVSEHAQRERS